MGSTPTNLPTTSSFMTLSCGGDHTVAINSAGELYSWGANISGQLGSGGVNPSSSAAKRGSAQNWVCVSAGRQHTAAINSSGALYACGLNSDGQLGIGSNANTATLTKVGNFNNWVSVSCGAYHTVAINSEGELYAWGKNDKGQLGDGTYSNKNTPTRIGTLTNWVKVNCGHDHTTAITSSSNLYAWGNNANSQLGDDTTLNKNMPMLLGLGAWTATAGGKRHTIAIRFGELYAWGDNSNGQLGDGSLIQRKTPTKIGAANNWVRVSCGDDYTAAINSAGELYTWGANNLGQLGDGTLIQKIVPTRITARSNWTHISCGRAHTIGLNLPDSALARAYGWGDVRSVPYQYRVVVGYGDLVLSPAPITNSSGSPISTIVQISASDDHIAAITSDGELYITPQTLSKLDSYLSKVPTSQNFVRVSAGSSFTFAINSAGELYTCSHTTPYGVLTKVGTATNWVDVSAGGGIASVINSEGELYVWGSLGSVLDSITPLFYSELPTKITTLTNWVCISCGNMGLSTFGNLFMINSSGKLYKWGEIWDGRIVMGVSRIGSASNWVSVSAGGASVAAINSAGELYVWGANCALSFTDCVNTDDIIMEPRRLGSASNWVRVSCGGDHIAAINSAGELYIWGDNLGGQLGTGLTPAPAQNSYPQPAPRFSYSPIRLAPGLKWTDISLGGGFSIGLTGPGAN